MSGRRWPGEDSPAAGSRVTLFVRSTSWGGAVLAEPGDSRTAAARRLRAAHTERERTVDALKAAYVQDRLTKDEFDERIGEALAARTYAELATLTVDIPVGPAVARPPDRPPRRRAGNAARWGASGLVSPALVLVALASAALNGGSGYWMVAVVAAIVYFVVRLSAGADMLWQRHVPPGVSPEDADPSPLPAQCR
jgi:hypothetical protein